MGRSTINDHEMTGMVGQDQVAIVPIGGDHSRTVMLYGEMDENLVAGVIVQMMTLAQVSHDPIYLVISTCGGAIDEMFGLYDLIKFLPCPVYTVGLGKIMSAGVLLLASGQKGNRLLAPSARIMLHPISGMTLGNVFESMTQLDEMKRLQKQFVKLLSLELGCSKKIINKIMARGSDYFLTQKKALKLGIIDEILTK